jgi:beta-galactosidase beta subunit
MVVSGRQKKDIQVVIESTERVQIFSEPRQQESDFCNEAWDLEFIADSESGRLDGLALEAMPAHTRSLLKR